ncbi:secreted RxLR effector, putative [Phytophthora infestans T30-4]|uniref:Secreted RxLR effector, putative n=1 Tax=Phytophthora infestans (strain T30-4) TaxID=403677 RepID=D0NWW4_PHYIT|nr:secreted RxLR effector, putative [Phytophthora infestans T30-4]EEY67551.1 secreted RxLR effector, putative [Phytophthora infestans T30-4]|eukprot:XP_002896410.1 secreted RxLR effector, putative [Phytophthora infestans T30-4]
MNPRANQSYHAVVLTLVALLVCVSAGSIPSELNSMKISANSFDTRVRRYLRAPDLTTEDRAFDALGLTKLKDVATTGTQKLQKLASNANTKMTSNNQQATDKLFKKLKVGKVEQNIFESSQFKQWAASVAKSYKKNAEAGDFAMVSTLSSRYGDDVLASMVITAKSSQTIDPSLENKLMSSLLTKWQTEARTTDDVFKLLKLDIDEVNLLKSPVLSTWISYGHRVGGKSPSGKTATDASNILKLKEEGASLLKNPTLPIWISYVYSLKQNPYELLLLKFKAHHTDASVARVIASAKSDQNSIIIVQNMQRTQIESWLKAGKSDEELFKLLELNKAGDQVLEDPLWRTWVAYLKNLKGDADNRMYSVLKTQLGEEQLTKIITRAKTVGRTKATATKLELQVWGASGRSADDVFDLLKLDVKKSDVVESVAFKTWYTYMKTMKQYNEKAVITKMEKHFGERSQFSKWEGEKKNPKTFSSMLSPSDRNSESDRVMSDFNTFFGEGIFDILRMGRQ